MPRETFQRLKSYKQETSDWLGSDGTQCMLVDGRVRSQIMHDTLQRNGLCFWCDATTASSVQS
jgi:hypothetical protein